MYHNILVPLDGSTFGEHALPLALNLAQKSGATLHLTHVLLPLSAIFADAPPFVNSEAEGRLLDEQKSNRKAYLSAAATRLTSAGAVRVETALLEGDVVDMIRKQAVDTAADLVVMSTHGYGPFTRFWLGSIADELVRGPLAAPLLLIRPGDGAADLKNLSNVKDVLLPLDGSPLAEQMVNPAAAMAEAACAELTLLRVIKPLVPVTVPIEGQEFGHMIQGLVAQMETLQEKIRKEAQEYLTKVAEPLRQRGLKVKTCVETDEAPAPAILRHAQSVDIVALATHGYRGLSRLFLGSVADKVVRGAHLPVLVWRPKEI
jgi:nucleotide-binding universal stress UspA family protein